MKKQQFNEKNSLIKNLRDRVFQVIAYFVPLYNGNTL